MAKLIKIGDRLKIAKNGMFKGVEVTVTTIGNFDGRKLYLVKSDGELTGWYSNNELAPIATH